MQSTRKHFIEPERRVKLSSSWWYPQLCLSSGRSLKLTIVSQKRWISYLTFNKLDLSFFYSTPSYSSIPSNFLTRFLKYGLQNEGALLAARFCSLDFKLRSWTFENTSEALRNLYIIKRSTMFLITHGRWKTGGNRSVLNIYSTVFIKLFSNNKITSNLG